MKNFVSLAAFVAISLVCAAQQSTPMEKHLVKQETFKAISNEFSGDAAQENTRQIVQYHRIQGSPMMTDVAEQVVLAKLRSYGIESKVEKFPSDGKTKYQTHLSPMAWDMKGGELWVESVAGMASFEPYRVCRYSDVPMCVSTYSRGGEWSGELIDVGSGTSDKSYEGVDVRGKVALAYGYAANVVRQAVLNHGAVGVVIYPSASDRPDHPDMVRYNGIWVRAEELANTSSGFQISANQYTKLKALMSQGAVRVHGKVDATLGAGDLTLVHAYIRGSKDPQQEVLVTGHLDHPKWSANDNASGSGAMIELARTLQTLIAQKKLAAPERTIHFMWVPEFFGTMAYVTKHPEARRCGDWDDPRNTKPWASSEPCIIANINMDMVGEDTVKTNSRFYVTRTPDSVPSFLDALLTDVMAQTREANLYAPTGTRNYWQPEVIDYTQGSDHDVFLGLGVPSSMFGHDPDWTHHTSEDKMDKTDASEFRRVGSMAGAAVWWMAAVNANVLEAATEQLESTLIARTAKARFVSVNQKYSWDRSVLGDSITLLNARVARLQEIAMQIHTCTDCGIPFSYLINTRMQRTLLPSTSTGPRRLTVPPLYSMVAENITGDDKKWWDAQSARFSSESEGLATEPNLELIVFETMNFMDGKRSTKEIADLLSAEYLLDINQKWVDRVVGILAKQNLVAPK